MARVRHHQKHHAERPDAADSDHFDGGINQMIAIQQNAPIIGQRFTILRQRLPNQGKVSGRRGPVWMEDGRRGVADARLLAGGLHELRKHQFRTGVRCGLGDPLAENRLPVFRL